MLKVIDSLIVCPFCETKDNFVPLAKIGSNGELIIKVRQDRQVIIKGKELHLICGDCKQEAFYKETR